MKHIKILIAVALMLSCRTFAAHAQNYITFINDGIKYHILSNENKTVETVQGSQVGVNGHVTIPATTTYNGEEYTVVQIGQLSFMNKSNLKSIDLPSTITSIGDFAFDRCDSLPQRQRTMLSLRQKQDRQYLNMVFHKSWCRSSYL